MTSRELENLVEVGQLKRAPVNDGEIAGLVRSGEARLMDAANMLLSLESRFDLAYNAAHALALAALRRQGYRSDKRYTVFQTLPHTFGVASTDMATTHEVSRSPKPMGVRGHGRPGRTSGDGSHLSCRRSAQRAPTPNSTAGQVMPNASPPIAAARGAARSGRSSPSIPPHEATPPSGRTRRD